MQEVPHYMVIIIKFFGVDIVTPYFFFAKIPVHALHIVLHDKIVDIWLHLLYKTTSLSEGAAVLGLAAFIEELQ